MEQSPPNRSNHKKSLASSPNRLPHTLANKVVLVVFGKSALAQSIMLLLAKSGANLVLLCRPSEYGAATQMQAQIKAFNDDCLLLTYEKLEQNELEAIHQQLASQVGSVDVFLNLRRYSPLEGARVFPDSLRLFDTFVSETT